jgi:hypothetical protein
METGDNSIFDSEDDVASQSYGSSNEDEQDEKYVYLVRLYEGAEETKIIGVCETVKHTARLAGNVVKRRTGRYPKTGRRSNPQIKTNTIPSLSENDTSFFNEIYFEMNDYGEEKKIFLEKIPLNRDMLS